MTLIRIQCKSNNTAVRRNHCQYEIILNSECFKDYYETYENIKSAFLAINTNIHIFNMFRSKITYQIDL